MLWEVQAHRSLVQHYSHHGAVPMETRAAVPQRLLVCFTGTPPRPQDVVLIASDDGTSCCRVVTSSDRQLKEGDAILHHLYF